MSAAPTLKSGHLLKQGGGKMKVYQKRYFLLRGSQLYWFKKQGDVQHAGSVLLKSCSLTRYAEKERYMQLDTGDKVYHLKAECKQEADEWVEALALAGVVYTLSYGTGKETLSALQRLKLVGSGSRVPRAKPRPNSALEPQVLVEKRKRKRSFSETDAARQPGSRISARLKKESTEVHETEEKKEAEEESVEESMEESVEESVKQVSNIESEHTSELHESYSGGTLTFADSAGPSSGVYMAAIPAGISPVFERHRNSMTLGSLPAPLPTSVPAMQMPVLCSSHPGLQQFLSGQPLKPVLCQTSMPVLNSMPEQ